MAKKPEKGIKRRGGRPPPSNGTYGLSLALSFHLYNMPGSRSLPPSPGKNETDSVKELYALEDCELFSVFKGSDILVVALHFFLFGWRITHFIPSTFLLLLFQVAPSLAVKQ